MKLEPVEPLIHALRGERAMLDSDLARIYGVSTGALNRAVKRNRERFPTDFMFQLTADELDSLRCQTGILKAGRGRHRKFLPYAFTEQGVAMLSSVLRSRRAVLVNVEIMRAFVALRREAGRYEALGRKLAELEQSQKLQGEDIQTIFAALHQLEETSSWAYPEGRRLIGFRNDKPKREGK
ncbi:MAG: ORF6N domain-containing protein [Verrucomicrobia bacterium]|nr:ORF6N domain-containing protein [Verrucomicrobiota bacterium]